MADFSNDLNLALRIRALVEGQDAVVDLGSSFVDLNQRIENLIRGLTAISGSTDGAQREFEYLADAAQKYGLKILDLSDNYVKLIASSKGTALEGEAVKKVFESVSGAMSVLGGDTITTHRAFTALAQMMSKGQIYSEELKGQLAEAIPGALGIMSRALDISTKDLLALMEAGALGSEVLLPFADQLSKEFGNLASTGRTFTQAVNDLKNTWTLLMKRFEDSTGAFSVLSSGIELLSKSSGFLAGVVGVGLAVAFSKLTSSIAATAASVKNFIPLIGVQANATQLAAKANLDAAIATNATATANARAALSSENLLRAQLAVATNAQVRQRIEAALQVAVAQRIITDKQAAAAALQLAAAQGAIVRSTTLFSRALNLFAGPGGAVLTAIAAFGAMAFAFREQSDAVKNLSKSTDEYAESLKKMGAATTVESIKLLEEQRLEREKNIATLQRELELFQQIAKNYKEDALSVSVITKADKEATEASSALEKAKADLAETEAKLAISRSSLIDKTADIIEANERYKFSSDSLNTAIAAQIAEIKKLEKEKEAGLEVDARMDASYKNLSRLRSEATTSNAKLTESQNQYNEAFSAYAERQKQLALDVGGTTGTLEEQGLTVEQLSVRYGSLSKIQVAALARVNQLKNAVVELTARQENLGTSLRAEIELQERLAAATGNTEKQRSAAIAKAQIEQEISIQGVAIAETALRALEEEIVQKKILLETNPKLEKQTSEQIAKLEAQVIAQKAQVAQRIANAKAAAVEAEAAKVAGEVLSKSLERQRSEAAQAQAELSDLRQKYIDMAAAGDGMNELLRVMEMIRAKEKQIADQANNTEISTKAAFKSLGLNAEEVLAGMDFETRKAIDALKTLGIQGDLTGKDLRKSMDKAIDLVDSETEIKALIKALSEMKDAGVITSADLGVALAVLQQKLSDLQTGVDPVTRALEKLGVGVPEKLAAVAEAAKLNFLVIQQSAQPIENVRDAFLKYADASIAAANASGKVIDPMVRQRAESLGLLTAYENLVKGMKRANPELENMKDRFSDLSRVESERVSAIESIASAQESAARAEINYYKSIGATSVAMQKEQELAVKQIAFSKSLIAAKYAELKALLAEQGVKAALLEQNKASNPIYEKERELIEATVQAINQKIDALKKELNLVEETEKGLSVKSDATKKDKETTDEHTRSIKDNSEAQQENVKHTNDGKAALQGITEYLGKAREAMDGLSEKTRQLFEVELARGLAQRGVAGASAELLNATIAYGKATTETEKRVGSFSKELANANELIRQSAERSLTAMNGFAIWEVAIDRAAGIAKKAFYEQAIAAAQLQQQVEDFAATGILNLDQATVALSGFAQAAKNDFSNLDEQDLSNLNKSIDEATSKLERMKGEATDAKDRLAELNAEIASAKGDTDTADKLKLQLEKQQAIAEVERNLAEARNAQNTDLIRLYEAQLSKLDELYRIKEKNLEADIKAQKLAEQQKNAKDKTQTEPPKGQTGTTGTAPASGPTTINNTFLIDPTKLANEDWVKKNVMPTIEKVGRLRA